MKTVDLLTEHLELAHRSQQAYWTRETLRGVTFFEISQKLPCRAEHCRYFPDSIKQTKNRARLLLATFQCRLALRLTGDYHVPVIGRVGQCVILQATGERGFARGLGAPLATFTCA